jgi:hypothetical protein
MLTATVAHNSEVNLQRNFFGIISVKGFANVIKPYTAKKLIRKPTSKRYIGLNSRITQPAKDRLEIPSLLYISVLAPNAINVITVALTVEGEKSHSAQKGINTAATQIKTDHLFLTLNFLSVQSIDAAIIPT